MDLSGKYLFPLEVQGAEKNMIVLARNYYNDTLHVTVTSDAGYYAIPKDVTVQEGAFAFTVSLGDKAYHLEISPAEGTCQVCVNGETTLSGIRTSITDADDRKEKSAYRYRALILYSSITGNTERIAQCFKETLEHYRFSVDLLKITSKLEISRDFSDYDLVCLGSPIIAGSPTKVVMRKLSLGGSGSQPTGDTLPENAGPAGGPPPDMPGGPPPMPPMGNGPGTGDNTPLAATYAGGPPPHGIYQPLGLVFTTYGGGFYGSNEAMATLETLKLYLEVQNAVVVGKFACCGKETGPAGLIDGEIPRTFGGVELDPPVYYQDADGKYHAGSFFFHAHMEDKPCIRDMQKARFLMSDLIEDYFYTSDGIRRNAASQYISIS